MHIPPISRRRAVAGAAWSVPAVVAANAAPAYAASKVTADLVIDFDWSDWEYGTRVGPGRFYVCTDVANNGTVQTNGQVVITLTVPEGVTGTFPTPYGQTAWPSDWSKGGEGTNVLTVTMPGPIVPGERFHVSYWFATDDTVDAVTCVAGVSGGGETAIKTADNTATTTVRRPVLDKVGTWMGFTGPTTLKNGPVGVYYGLANGSTAATTGDLVVTLDHSPDLTARLVSAVPAGWELDLAAEPPTAIYSGVLEPGEATPTFEIEWGGSDLTSTYYWVSSDVAGIGVADQVVLNITNS